jgi:hypothetical protein
MERRWVLHRNLLAAVLAPGRRRAAPSNAHRPRTVGGISAARTGLGTRTAIEQPMGSGDAHASQATPWALIEWSSARG